jgi:hypothetical protein
MVSGSGGAAVPLRGDSHTAFGVANAEYADSEGSRLAEEKEKEKESAIRMTVRR